VDLLANTLEDTAAAAQALEISRHRAREAHAAWFREGRIAAPWVEDRVAPIERTMVDHDTVKFTMRLPDGLETESVVIPMYRDERITRWFPVEDAAEAVREPELARLIHAFIDWKTGKPDVPVPVSVA
jgi:hypothetical protein